MSCFLRSAKFITDVEDGCDYVEVEYVGQGGNTYVDYYNTTPRGDWIEITSLKRNIPLEKFLDTMLERNIEVLQKMCEIVLEQTDCSTRLMYTSKILDPTFIPPVVNTNSAWQCEFVNDFCMYTLPDLIYHCDKPARLEKFFNVVKMIQQQL